MQKKLVLIPIALVVSGVLATPTSIVHHKMVNAEIARQELALKKEQEAKEKKIKEAKAKKAAALAKKLANKTSYVDIKDKNKSLKVDVTEIDTGEQLGSKKIKSPTQRYVLIRMKMTNTAASSLMFAQKDFKLKIGDQTYTQTKEMTTNQAANKNLLDRAISVGGSLTGCAAWKVDYQDAAKLDGAQLIITNSYNNEFAHPLIITLNLTDSNNSNNNSSSSVSSSASSDTKNSTKQNSKKQSSKSFSSELKSDTNSKSNKSDSASSSSDSKSDNKHSANNDLGNKTTASGSKSDKSKSGSSDGLLK